RLGRKLPPDEIAAALTLHPFGLLHQPERRPGTLGRRGEHDFLAVDYADDPRVAGRATPPGERRSRGSRSGEEVRVAIDVDPYLRQRVGELWPEREADTRPLSRPGEERGGDAGSTVEGFDECRVGLGISPDACG